MVSRPRITPSQWRGITRAIKLGGQSAAIAGLDALEKKWFDRDVAAGHSKDHALRLIVGTVEGDCSQLSPDLATYAERKRWVRCR